MMQLLDGNALAGDLAEVFGDDLTDVEATCGGCGTAAMLAEIAVYASAMGMVGRCRRCDRVLVVAVHRDGRVSASLAGIGTIERME
ncbi:hypothetical protein ET445_03860 [Agromyces protaetiae]|uniref:Uncharacterized protein n=1 Tax=Agromyces protaetiae TaxID=2509455 RepID=A0A4P6FQ13_9MICO|nr:DUF6510 family protein [Agromyces protaetiae]QAY72608.1 hypothetical protein ET445_03860 [Agromyces protaetiae]